MKSVIALACIFGALIALTAQTAALPYPEEVASDAVDVVDLKDVDAVAPGQDVVGNNRQKRATCDLLSFTGANHSACAAHCVLLGKRGGYCNGQAVCVCRN